MLEEERDSEPNADEFVVRKIPGDHGVVIVRASDIPVLDRRMSIANQVMSERGFDPENIGDIPIEDIISMRAEIKKRMAETDE